MPLLTNPTTYDLFAAQIHRTVPAEDSIAVTDAEARLFAGNGVFRVEADEATESVEPAREPAEVESRSVTRRQVTRGGKSVEVAVAPPMETR